MKHQSYPGDLLLHLRSFSTVLAQIEARRGGAFSRAARTLAIDRSVLRRRVQTLTEWVGAPLLQGRGSGLVATAAGAMVAAEAERLARRADALPEVARGARAPLTVACTGTIAIDLLPEAICSFQRKAGASRVVVRRAGGELCTRLVERGEADIGVVRSVQPVAGAVRLCSDRLWLVAPAKHRLLGRRRPTLVELAGAPLVMYGESSRTRARIMERLAPLGAVIAIEVDGRATALEYVRRGLGVSFVSTVSWQRVKARGVSSREVTALFGRHSFYLLTSAARSSDAELQRFCQELREAAHRRPER